MLTVSLFSYRKRKREAQKVNILDNYLSMSTYPETINLRVFKNLLAEQKI